MAKNVVSVKYLQSVQFSSLIKAEKLEVKLSEVVQLLIWKSSNVVRTRTTRSLESLVVIFMKSSIACVVVKKLMQSFASLACCSVGNVLGPSGVLRTLSTLLRNLRSMRSPLHILIIWWVYNYWAEPILLLSWILGTCSVWQDIMIKWERTLTFCLRSLIVWSSVANLSFPWEVMMNLPILITLVFLRDLLICLWVRFWSEDPR